MVDFTVDFDVGTGIWMKNVCFGGSVPDEDVLKRFGLSCEGTSTLDGCEFDEDGRDVNGNEEGTRIRAAEVLSVFSLACAFLGLLAACCATPGSVMRIAFASLFSVLTLSSAIFVIEIMNESQMMDKNFSCHDVFGADLCFRIGPSKTLQLLGITLSILSVSLFMTSSCMSRRARMLSEFSAFDQQRYAVPAGVVVV